MSNRLILLFLVFCASMQLVACQEKTSTAIPTQTTIPLQSSTNEVMPTATVIVDELTAETICFPAREITPFAFTPSEANLLMRASSGVQIIDLPTGQQTWIKAPQNVTAAVLSPDGQILAWSLEDHRIQLIRLSDQEIIADLIGHPDPIFDLLFSPLGDKLFSASHDGLVRVWSLDGIQLDSIEVGAEVLGMGLSPDGMKLATIPFDGPVRLWDLTDNTSIVDIGGTGGYDTSDAHFSPDGQFLAVDLATGLYLWRISDDELLWNEVKNSMAVAFSPDGRYLAYSDVDGQNSVVLASPDGSQIIRTLGWMQGPVWELFFSPDGVLLAATDGIEIQIWHVEDGKLLYMGKSECLP